MAFKFTVTICLAFAACSVSVFGQTFDPANWMKMLMPVIGKRSVLDISLPGAHDTLTSNLSSTVAENANTLDPKLSSLLHSVGRTSAGNFVRKMAMSQGLSMTEMLESGIRFIDFRLTYTTAPDTTGPRSWYGVHTVQTKQLAFKHLVEAKVWMDTHPNEIVVFWFSRHGNNCSGSFPGASTAIMREFWGRVEGLFGGLLFDSSQGHLNETSIDTMISRGQRAVFYWSMWAQFTGSSPKAMDDCLIDNETGNYVYKMMSTTPHWLTSKFADGKAHKTNTKKRNKFYLLSMASQPPADAEMGALMQNFFPSFDYVDVQKCIKGFNIPGMGFCPSTLMEVGLLTNYYNQMFFDHALKMMSQSEAWDFPNAIYLDGVDHGGLIRTGTAYFGPNQDPQHVVHSNHETTGYAYVAVVALANVMSSCAASYQPQCLLLNKVVQAAINANPITLWNDPVHGRLPTFGPY